MRWTGSFAVHQLFEIAGYVLGMTTYAVQRARRGDVISDESRVTVLAGAALGAMMGARLLFWLCEPAVTAAHWRDLAYLFGGKTIVGGLLGGLIGVELAKRLAGITRSTGDLFVEPLIVAIAVGRIGCFLAGPADHTAGKPTSLPWAIAVADGVPRHPVALYEIAFLIALWPLLRVIRRRARAGDSFRLFLASYLAFRFFVDFLKPDPPPLVFGLTAIQYACLGGLIYYGLVLSNDDRHASLPFLRRRRVGVHDVLPEG